MAALGVRCEEGRPGQRKRIRLGTAVRTGVCGLPGAAISGAVTR